jgi:hypothetical protein
MKPEEINTIAGQEKGCARNQQTTQFCAEAVSLLKELDAARVETFAARLRTNEAMRDRDNAIRDLEFRRGLYAAQEQTLEDVRKERDENKCGWDRASLVALELEQKLKLAQDRICELEAIINQQSRP